MFKKLLLSTALLACLGFSAYWILYRKVDSIPQLLERHGALSLSAEWKNTKAAIGGLQAKIRRNPEDYTSKLMLAYGYMQEARITGEHPYYYPASLELIEDVLNHTRNEDPVHVKALVAKASVQLSLHHFADALETGQEAIALNPNDKDLFGVLCDANVELGRYDEAIKMADRMVAIRPDLSSYSRVSYLREIHGDMPGAIQAMQLAVDAGYPGLEQTCWTRYNLGKLYEKAGDTSKARQEYEVVLMQNHGYAFALAGIAGLTEKSGQHDKALKLYADALEMMPEFSFQEEIARIYVKTKDPRAKEAIDQTVTMLEEDIDAGHDASLEMANLHLTLSQDYDEALEYAESAYEKRPDNIDVNRAMALIQAKRGKVDEARKYATNALRTHKVDKELQMLASRKS